MSDEFIKVRSEYPPTVPLSHLELDLDRPVEGWPNFLGARGMAIIPDDLGRDCVSRQHARMLLDEKREADLKQAALARLAEQESDKWHQEHWVEPRGIHWSEIPDGVSPVVAMTAAAKAAQPRTVPSQTEWLFGEADTMVYHPMNDGEEAS